MTVNRMIELLKIEDSCVLRNSHDDCDRDCENCGLVQDDGELHEMYMNVIGILKDGQDKDAEIASLKVQLAEALAVRGW